MLPSYFGQQGISHEVVRIPNSVMYIAAVGPGLRRRWIGHGIGAKVRQYPILESSVLVKEWILRSTEGDDDVVAFTARYKAFSIAFPIFTRDGCGRFDDAAV